MGTYRRLAWILALTTPASAAGGSKHRADPETTEAAYRAFFSARLALFPHVALRSDSFDQLLADPGSRGWTWSDDDPEPVWRWDGDVGDVLESVRVEWKEEKDGVALLQAKTTMSPHSFGGIPETPPRLVLLLRVPTQHYEFSPLHGVEETTVRRPDKPWQVACDVATNREERRILRGSRRPLSSGLSDSARTACMSSVTSWLGALPRESADERRLLDGGSMFHVAVASDMGLIVIAHFEERDEIGPHAASWSTTERFLLLSLHRLDDNSWTVSSVHRAL
jgi:hypothetical protein